MAGALEGGTIFAGRYRVVRCLAEGGMGAVYEVVHLETERRRALKVMHSHLFRSDDMRARFKLEARIAAQVESEYIVDVFDAGVDEATQTPFLVMELLRGEELGDRLKRMERLPPDEVVTYMQQAAWALDRTHAASIVHRDLKPENIFLTHREDGTPRIKILDFGVAKLVAEGATAAGATRSLGTPLYMAPEQFRGNTKLTGAADIYSLTLMTYTLLVGTAYWLEEAQGTGDVLAFAMIAVQGCQESAVARAARRGVTLPAGFDAWFARGTAVGPQDRFPTASEAVRALREVVDARVASSPPRPSSESRPSPASSPNVSLPAVASSAGSPSALGRAATSTGAAITPAAFEPKPRWRAAIGVSLALGMVGVGAWAASRARSTARNPSSPSASVVVVAAPPLASSPPPSVGGEVTAESAAPAPSIPTPVLPSATASAGPSPHPPSANKPQQHPILQTQPKAPATSPAIGKLLGRD